MIPVYKPKLQTEEILNELRPVLNSGWVGLGPKVKEFETLVESFLNTKHVVALNSCTSALHLAIKTLPKTTGKYVITTPITFVSTNHAILYENLEPVFADVEPRTGNLDHNSVEAAIKQLGPHNVRAILLVHLGGYPVDLDAFNALGRKYNIPIIEDCAHSFGAKYHGKMIGDSDNICCWSFQAVKNMPVGDGGAISTKDSDLDKKLRRLRWLGIDIDTVTRATGGYKWEYNVPEIGYKYHMSDIVATIGCVQMRHIENDNARRQEIASFYKNNIKNLTSKVWFPSYELTRESSHWFYPVFFKDRDKVYEALTKNEIYPSMHFRSNLKYPMFEKCLKMNNCGNATWYEDHVLSLPIHLYLTEEELTKIVDIVNSALYD
jgi:dTDP-4-amino-4,6-dideoxygalactose transaminase